ncbi:MAG: AMP-binding protein [Pseudonocardiaceae bacterium]
MPTLPPPQSVLTWSANAAEMVTSTAGFMGEATAVIESGSSITHAALAARAGAIAQVVSGIVAPGERVAIFLRRGADAVAAYFGVLAAGAVAVVVNESLRPRQIVHVTKHATVSVVLTSGDMLPRLPRLSGHVRLLDLADIPPCGDLEPVSRVNADVAQIVYTSGSTGMPKGVTISHANLWAGMRSVVSYLKISSADRIASLLPLSFDYGLNQVLCCAGTGAALVVERAALPPRIVETLAREEVTVLPAVPPLWLQLLGVARFQTKVLPHLRLMTNTGGHLPTEAVRRLRVHQPQADLVLMYGLTEAFRSTYLRPEAVDTKPASIGRAIPGAEILVVDDEFRPCRPGQVGQLVHRGPTVALGYWNDPDATAARFRPNPLRPTGTPDAERVAFSGDMVYRDEDGDLVFVGREDTMIKTLGYRVSPDEVTDVIYASGEVLEAVIVSEPDEERGSRIVAYVVLADQGDAQRLASFCARELPRYMQPSRIELRSELPRTASGKHDPTAVATPTSVGATSAAPRGPALNGQDSSAAALDRGA